MGSLGDGLTAVRYSADGLNGWELVARDASVVERLREDLMLESKKFLVYRAFRLRDRQWISLRRLKALRAMFEEAERRHLSGP